MPDDFLQQVSERVLVSDGAMGTMLYARGVFINRSYDELNLSQPAVVKEIHLAYAHAGAEIIETNTFGASPIALEKYGLREKAAAINRAGVALARECAGDAWVAGAIGPLGVYLEPLGKLSFEEARAAFREQAAALAESGADLLMLETFGQVNELREAIFGARDACNLPIAAQITIDDEGRALDGTPAQEAARRMHDWGADIIGINCSGGPVGMLEALEAMARATTRPLIAQPNAGKPRNVEGRNLYMVSPEYLADYARQFITAGAKIVGGCCGTTPEHIKWIRNYVRSTTPGRRRVQVNTVAKPDAEERKVIPAAERSALGRRLAEGKFVTLVEILPPRGSDATKELESAAFFEQHGADAINIPDGPRANARMSNQALALMLRSRLQIEPVLHYCCRDRNVISMQSDLLGGYALGLRNLILITGDPPKLGNYPDATAVFDVDAIGLANLVSNLNRGLDLGGNAVGGQTSFLIGVGANPGALNYEEELRRYRFKVEAGADYIVTQPVFDLEVMERFLHDTESHRRPLLAGIWPLTSARQAEFMQNELHVQIPPAVLERMRAARTAEAAKAEGLAIAQEMVRALRGKIAGIQISVLGRNQAGAVLLATAQENTAAA
ncbi:MAG: bifunctional homocysteine S-methyltransferase/methylenetetrahydrofolate reductase [Acidobacteria bacterium]|nr:MAG: bifunctional homocysteine S-methyltransferase/methylenetetrahydrofolate reductase [Acidobacteriota bacterium]